MNAEIAPLSRLNHITQGVRIIGSWTLDVNIHDNPQPKKLFRQVKGLEFTIERYAALHPATACPLRLSAKELL
jgi:hypothetical protein